MEEKIESEGLAEHIEGFSETFLKLTYVNITQKGINIASGMLNTLVVYVVGVFVLLFAATGVAWWLGDIMNNHAAGFFAVAGFFLIMILFIILFRKKIIFPFIRNSMVRKVYE